MKKTKNELLNLVYLRETFKLFAYRKGGNLFYIKVLSGRAFRSPTESHENNNKKNKRPNVKVHTVAM